MYKFRGERGCISNMIIKLAGLIIEVKSRYKYTFDMCHDYLYSGEEKPVFTVFATNAQIEEERKKTPGFPNDMLENTSIYRNICKEILMYDGLFLHSAAISVDNEAYLFTADSGTGKTTHMNLWLERFGERAFVINGDKPIIRKKDGVFYACGTPWCGKEMLNKNVCVPLKGIGIISRSAENNAQKLDGRDAFLFLVTQTIHPNGMAYGERFLKIMNSLISEIPVYRLNCNMNPSACDTAYAAMNGEK